MYHNPLSLHSFNHRSIHFPFHYTIHHRPLLLVLVRFSAQSIAAQPWSIHHRPLVRFCFHVTLINGIWTEEKDELMNGDSEKFDSILHEFDKLHEQVKKPREQVADAEALLDLTHTLVGSVKSLVNEGVTPSQFVSSLLKHYAHAHPPNNAASIDWHKLGISVSPIFLTVHGSSTMLFFHWKIS
jgi:hypothetical protein